MRAWVIRSCNFQALKLLTPIDRTRPCVCVRVCARARVCVAHTVVDEYGRDGRHEGGSGRGAKTSINAFYAV